MILVLCSFNNLGYIKKIKNSRKKFLISMNFNSEFEKVAFWCNNKDYYHDTNYPVEKVVAIYFHSSSIILPNGLLCLTSLLRITYSILAMYSTWVDVINCMQIHIQNSLCSVMCFFFALQIISPRVHIFGFDGFKFLGKVGYIEIDMVSDNNPHMYQFRFFSNNKYLTFPILCCSNSHKFSQKKIQFIRLAIKIWKR